MGRTIGSGCCREYTHRLRGWKLRSSGRLLICEWFRRLHMRLRPRGDGPTRQSRGVVFFRAGFFAPDCCKAVFTLARVLL